MRAIWHGPPAAKKIVVIGAYGDIDENAFLEALTHGVARTSNLIAQATDYRYPVMTESLLTGDIAREFIERGYPVTVECHNRMFVNAMTGLKAAQPRNLLRSKRTDVADIADQ